MTDQSMLDLVADRGDDISLLIEFMEWLTGGGIGEPHSAQWREDDTTDAPIVLGWYRERIERGPGFDDLDHEHDDDCGCGTPGKVMTHHSVLTPSNLSHQSIVEHFIGIDPVQLERERRALLDSLSPA